MAGKTRPMSQIKQLIRLHQNGYGIKTIARTLSISKNTVKAYLKKIQEGELDTKALLSEDDPVVEKTFHAGNPAYKNDNFEYLKSRLSYFKKELEKTGVDRKLLWEEYITDNPGGYRYSQFCFHLSQQLVARRGSMVMEHRPGDKLYIDFSGKKMHYIDRSSGEVIPCEIFVACLPFSDFAFVMAVRSQQTPDFLYALDCCLQSLGGVPQALVPDNLKAAVIKADRYEPTLNRCMEDFANHYGTVVVPARPGKPQDKGLVENQVNLIYTRVFARLRNVQFFDIHSLNEAIKECVLKHNQTRMQQKPYCREERFLSAEKHLLNKLPEERFEMKHYSELKVAANGHIYLKRDLHYYSVPYTHIGAKAKVIYTRGMVYIYVKGKQVAVHIRSYQKSGYSTVAEHLSSQHQMYQQRSPDYYIERARKHSPEFHLLVQTIFQQNRYPEQLYKTCDGLMRLQRTFPDQEFVQACEFALEHRIYTYTFLQNVLKNGTALCQERAIQKPLPEHHNIRGRDYYTGSQTFLFEQ